MSGSITTQNTVEGDQQAMDALQTELFTLLLPWFEPEP